MRKYVWLAIVAALSAVTLFAQPANKAASDAFVLTRMISKFHVQPRALDDQLSVDFFNHLLKELDEDRIFFTAEDMARLQVWQLKLDDQVRERKTDFLQLLTSLYQQHLLQADTMIDNICKAPFNFSVVDKFTAQEDTSYPLNNAALRSKLYKRIKLTVLNTMLDYEEEISAAPANRQKKMTDSLEVVLRKRTGTVYKRSISRLKDGPGGLAAEVGDTYCKALALCYDPHTAYFPPTEKENFTGMLGGDHFEFGFQVNESEDEGVEIETLKPGSPAFKSGMLNKGDKIQWLKWEGQKAIDVSDASTEEVARILMASNHDKLVIAVKKADGTTREVTLQKEKSGDEDGEEMVKSFILKGTKTIGYISLPSFYTDWSENENDEFGCANDVAKEIVKLKKEKIDGLVLDVRYNGGGSMQEAIQLSGIFIDAGPVGQQKSNDGKVYTLKDVNRGTIYDGPLVLMVNGYSASASEMIAGTLQDYNRALIVGTPTYGKATAQVVLPMDSTLDPTTKPLLKEVTSYIKVTTGRLYRINGTTAQGKGVIPDITIPDMSAAEERREANEANTLLSTSIEPNKYYKPYPPLNTAGLKAVAETTIASSDYYKTLSAYINLYKTLQQPHDVTLNWTEALKEQKAFDELLHKSGKPTKEFEGDFSIINNSFENQRLATNADQKAINEETKSYLMKDVQLKIAYELACKMIK